MERPTGKTEPIQVTIRPNRMPTRQQLGDPAIHFLSGLLASFLNYLSDSYLQVSPILTKRKDNIIRFLKY